MSKTIEEILSPKPEARPRIYAYSIADKAHAGLLKVGQTTRDVPSQPRRGVIFVEKHRKQMPSSVGATSSRLCRPYGALAIRPTFLQRWHSYGVHPCAPPMSKPLEEILSPKP